MARRKRRRSAVGRVRRRRRRRVYASNPVRRRRRRSYRRNPVRGRRRRRRSYRRNPGVGVSGGGIVRTLVQGAKDGLAVSLGRGVTKLVAQRIPFGQTSTVGQAGMQLLVGTVLAMAIKKVVRSDRVSAMFLAGAYSNVIQTALAPVPVLGPALSGVASWPRVNGGAVSAWPQRTLPAASDSGPSNATTRRDAIPSALGSYPQTGMYQ